MEKERSTRQDIELKIKTLLIEYEEHSGKSVKDIRLNYVKSPGMASEILDVILLIEQDDNV